MQDKSIQATRARIQHAIDEAHRIFHETKASMPPPVDLSGPQLAVEQARIEELIDGRGHVQKAQAALDAASKVARDVEAIRASCNATMDKCLTDIKTGQLALEAVTLREKEAYQKLAHEEYNAAVDRYEVAAREMVAALSVLVPAGQRAQIPNVWRRVTGDLSVVWWPESGRGPVCTGVEVDGGRLRFTAAFEEIAASEFEERHPSPAPC